jgi:hypothetical protein
MTFLIADTFTDSLARLTGDEQKAAKTTAFDLQMDPSAPGMSFHRLDKAKDKRFWSVRVPCLSSTGHLLNSERSLVRRARAEPLEPGWVR